MKAKNSHLMKIIVLLVVSVVYILLTRTSIWESIFGDVESVASVLQINWISIFKIIAIILFTALLVNVLRFILEHIHPKSNKGKSVHSMLESFTLYALVLIAIIWSLSSIGVNISTIFASIGIIALIIGFAAESLIADIITGIFLVFEDEFNVGDIIEISGFRGRVTRIGVRVTYIQDNGGNIKIINNSAIKEVMNKSKVRSMAACDVSVSYRADLKQVAQVMDGILQKAYENHSELFIEAPSYLGVQELTDSAVVLRIVAPVAEENVFTATRLLNYEVKVGLDEAGIEIPFPQIVVHQA